MFVLTPATWKITKEFCWLTFFRITFMDLLTDIKVFHKAKSYTSFIPGQWVAMKFTTV